MKRAGGSLPGKKKMAGVVEIIGNGFKKKESLKRKKVTASARSKGTVGSKMIRRMERARARTYDKRKGQK